MHIYRVNRPLFSLPESHPAHRFLRQFIKCQQNCVGREIPYRGREHLAVDQEWFSATDKRMWHFSGLAYMYISFTVELDGWLTDAPAATESEKSTLENLPYLRTLLGECKEACLDNGNTTVLAMVEQVEEVLDLWEFCIEERLRRCREKKGGG
jgi:hypothetical protein